MNRSVPPRKRCAECGCLYGPKRNSYSGIYKLSNFSISRYCSQLCRNDSQSSWREQIGRMQELCDADWRLLAMTVDLEGCIIFTRHHKSVRCKVDVLGNTNKKLIDYFLKLTAGSLNTSRGGPRCKNIWRVELGGGKSALYFLQGIQPYLIAKGRQAELAIEMIQLQRDKAFASAQYNIESRLTEIYEEGRKLNKKGSLDV